MSKSQTLGCLPGLPIGPGGPAGPGKPDKPKPGGPGGPDAPGGPGRPESPVKKVSHVFLYLNSYILQEKHKADITATGITCRLFWTVPL